MILHDPFLISARLLPALRINDSTLSWDGNNFYIDTPEDEFVIDDFHPGPWHDTQECFKDILSFMEAANEAYLYDLRTGVTSDNSGLFSPEITQWIVDHINEIEMLACEIEDENNLIEE